MALAIAHNEMFIMDIVTVQAKTTAGTWLPHKHNTQTPLVQWLKQLKFVVGNTPNIT